MYPAGTRLAKTERSCAVANVPRNQSGKSICWDFNSHGGCKFGNKCFDAHETMLPTGVHWCVRAEMARRGGFQTGKKGSIPPMLMGMGRSLREANARVPGEQKVTDNQQVGSAKFPNPTQSLLDVDKTTTVTETCVMANVKTGDNNPAAPSAPSDFLNFDFAEMEHIGNALFHAKDEWVHQDKESSTIRQSSDLTPEQSSVELWWKSTEPPVDSAIETFVKKRMVVELAGGKLMEDALTESLILLSQMGTTRETQLAEQGLEAWRSITTKGVGRSDRRFFLGPKFPLEDCDAQEFVVGRLTFHLLEYGDEIKLTLDMRKLLVTGGETERNQCAALAFSEGYGRVGKTRKSKSPPMIQTGALRRSKSPFPRNVGSKADFGRVRQPCHSIRS